MERTLEIKVISAKGIKDVNLISKMDVYAVVSIAGGDYNYYNNKHQHQQKAKTPVDRAGGVNPTWNHPLKFTVQEDLAQQNMLSLVFKLRCLAALGDKDVGEVNVPVKELLDDFRGGQRDGEVNNGGDQRRAMRFVTYQVRMPSGRPKGELNLSYRFTASSTSLQNDHQPVNAYPATAAGPSVASAPPYPYHFPQPLAYPHQAYPGVYPPPAAPPVYGYPSSYGYQYGYR